DRFFLAVGEARYSLALDDRLALVLNTVEDTRRMADRGHRFAGAVEVFDESNRNRVLGQIPHRAVAAGIEDRVVVRGLDLAQPHGVGEHCLRRGITLESPRQIRLALRRVADRVERWLP